jgi:hypothetical protein
MVMVLLAFAAVAHGSMDAWLSRMAETSSIVETPPDGFTPAAGLGRLAPRPANRSATIVVAKDGSGHFKSVHAAVSSIPLSNSRRIVIYIKEGIYRYGFGVLWVLGSGQLRVSLGSRCRGLGPGYFRVSGSRCFWV